MKRYFIALLIGAILLILASCGGDSTPAELSDSFIKRDVQDYITEMLDENSKITIFEKVSSDINGDEMIVICNALFTVDDQQQQGEFTLTYEVENKAWALSKCRVELPEEEKKSNEKNDEINSNENKNVESSVSSSATEKEELDEPEIKLPEQKTDVVQLSDNLFDYTFKLDGVVYKLPCDYSLFKDNGWVISSRGVTENDEIAANSYQYFDMIKNGSEITLYVINLSGNVKAIKNCKIGGIEVTHNDLADVDIFTIAKGINLNSSADDITTAFGAANTINTYDDNVYSTYSQDTYHDVKFTTYTNGTTKWNSITIRNYVSDASDVTETSTEVPEYLATYVSPTELGTDPMSGNIEIDGDVYRLPCPVSAFINNGWSITQQPGGVGAGNTDSIRIERNGKKLYLYIINFGSYQTLPANCAVYKVYAYDSDKIPVKLPGDISFESTKTDVENYISDEFSYYKGSSSYSYSYDNYNIDFNMSIHVNIETEKVSQISLGCKNWDY